jgi:hypothetical protein
MGPNFGVGQDVQSQAYFRREQAGEEQTPIPGEVDSPSVVTTVDGGTSIPGQVDSPGQIRVER